MPAAADASGAEGAPPVAALVALEHDQEAAFRLRTAAQAAAEADRCHRVCGPVILTPACVLMRTSRVLARARIARERGVVDADLPRRSAWRDVGVIAGRIGAHRRSDSGRCGAEGPPG